MCNAIKPILRIPENIRQDTLSYCSKVKEFFDGLISPEDFRACHIPMGIYEQRTKGKYMIRIRIGAGLVLPSQLRRIALLSKTYGDGILHITTRQDIQIHCVNIEDTPIILEKLLQVGLSPRGGGGNTVRNVTACPKAGVCPSEKFDVAPYAIATAEYLLKDIGSFNLPRKYKIVFSGCSEDCALASVADLGFFAHINDGINGFAVYAAGGLGANPAIAVKIEDFVEAKEVLEVAEAIKRLFDKHGNKSNRQKARLRYVLAKLGTKEFTKLYLNERQALKDSGLVDRAGEIRDIASDYSVPHEPTVIRLRLKNGDIPADDLDKVGRLAAEYAQGPVRVTQLQDLLITTHGQKNIDKINDELKNLGIDVFGNGPTIVACTGASTCKLGLCLSRGLSQAISNSLSQISLPKEACDVVIRISGCPNSCANHLIADIGFQGRAKKINGKRIPCYDVLIDGQSIEAAAKLAKKIGTVPAKRIPDLLSKALLSGNDVKENLKSLIPSYSRIDEKSIPDDYCYDYGATTPFSLTDTGPSQCGGALDKGMDIEKLKDSFNAELGNTNGSAKINLCDIPCPLNFAKAKLALEKIKIDKTLEILLNHDQTVKNIVASLTQQGQEVIEVKKTGDCYCVKVCRKK